MSKNTLIIKGTIFVIVKVMTEDFHTTMDSFIVFTGGQQQQETIVPIKSQWRESTSLVESSVSQATVPMQPKMNFVGGATIKPVHLMQATD